jgi:hypothetical protein
MGMTAELMIEHRGRRFSNANDLSQALMTEITADIDLATGRVSEVLLATLNQIYAHLEQVHGSQWPLSGNEYGTDLGRLARRSGQGLASIRNSITIRDDSWGYSRIIEGSISTAALTVHETGATITARNAQYLTIPLRAALDSSGLPLRQRARDWDKTFVKRSKAGNLLIFRRDGKNLVPLYVLKNSVYVPPRLQMRETVELYAREFGERLTSIFNPGNPYGN